MPSATEAFGDLRMRPTNWLGPVEDKLTAFSRAQWTVIIENSPDYVSEKLIDAVVARAAPIYVGPKLETFGFPANIAIACAPTSNSVVDALMSVSPERLTEVLHAGEAWLQSDSSRSHEITVVLSKLGTAIGRVLDQRAG